MDSSTNSTSSSEDELHECGSDAKSKLDLIGLPAKSRERYLKVYECFNEWRNTKRFKSLSEAVFLAYFKELSKTKSTSTLSSTYSILRSTIKANHGVQINTYCNLVKFLKTRTKGQVTRKSKVFTVQDVDTFINDAPDDIYLDIKVALIFALCGSCRASELIRIRTQDVQKHSDQVMLVNLMKTPSKILRSFLVRDKYVEIVEKYKALRPPRMFIDRFFINYQHGKCTRQAIGRNKLTVFPRKIATFLGLPDLELYRGHCLRNSAASLGLAQSNRWRTSISESEILARSTNTVQRLRSDPYWRARPAVAVRSESPGTSHSEPHETEHFAAPVYLTQLLKIQQSESLDETRQVKLEWIESPAESQSVRSDEQSEQIPEEYELSRHCVDSQTTVTQPPRPRNSLLRRLATLELRRLKLDAARARQLHARESRRLQVRARQLEVDRDRNEALRRIADVATAWLEKTANGVSRH